MQIYWDYSDWWVEFVLASIKKVVNRWISHLQIFRVFKASRLPVRARRKPWTTTPLPSIPHITHSVQRSYMKYTRLSNQPSLWYLFLAIFWWSSAFTGPQGLETASTSTLIVNMAISDLLYIFVSGPMFRIKSLVDVSTSTGMLLCRILHPTKIVAHFVSIESLVLIAADRYIATVKPFKAKKVTTRTRAVLISLSWLLAALVLVPLAYHSKYPTIRNIVFCSPIWTDAAVTIYGRVLLTMYYCVPLAVITVLYSRITRTLKRRPLGNNLQGGANLRRLKEQRKIMTILVSIVSAFFVCWTPFAIFATGYLSVSLTSFKRFSKHTCYVINIVAYRFCPLLSTAINPTILFTLGTKYRKALTNLFSCFVGKLRPRSRRIVHEEPAC